ncbi:cysteine--tRNA ligase [Gammaproteobacteria bacterium]
MLHIYNTFSKKKELFRPIAAPKIGLYVCGLTVYDDCHIGHGRLFIWFDVVVRYLRSIGYQVTYIRNITDIDDKIIKRAQELTIDYKTLTANVIASMHTDEKSLSIIPPDFEPHVTDNIQQIIDLIQTLVDKGFAYTTTTGDVYYEVAKFKSYGELAHQDLNSLRSGIRVGANESKRDPLDFALWKAAKPNEPFWPSPWGNGRPGWHIECSAMSKKYLGENFDIHGGGNDLQFPHHQNELAQSEAANGCRFVNYWMHMGFVQVDQEKMSKSLGNFFTLKEVLKKYRPEILRYFVVASHYRSPINFSEENLENAHAALRRFYITLRDLPLANINDLGAENQFNQRFRTAMNDDFNTPEALAVLFDLAREINRLRSAQQLTEAAQYGTLLKHFGWVLGILQDDPEKFLKTGIDASAIEALITARNAARKNKNWAEADRIRNKLTSMKITLEDTANGTTWLVEDKNQK